MTRAKSHTTAEKKSPYGLTLQRRRIEKSNFETEQAAIPANQGRDNPDFHKDRERSVNNRINNDEVPRNAIKVETTFKLNNSYCNEHDAHTKARNELHSRNDLGSESWGTEVV